MRYTIEELQREISRRGPWYQSIDFPAHGISTTDFISDALLDAAWDNKIETISIEEAARLRPKPKYELFQGYLPAVSGLDVLEIGSNCGFFSFEFARMGAKRVVGLDVSPRWLDNAEWARQVLGHDNVSFHNCDFMRYDGSLKRDMGLLSHKDISIPLPNNLFDMAFMSTVLDHLFFPLFAIYKMCRISRKWVVIDVPCAKTVINNEKIARLGVPADNSHHGFTFSTDFISTFVSRLGIPSEDIVVYKYKQEQNAIYVIDVSRMSKALNGA